MTDDAATAHAHARIQNARQALARFVRDAYTSTQFVQPGSDSAADQARSGSDHIPNRLIEGLIASAADHLKAWLRASEPPAGERLPLLHIYADYTLWRAILESVASGIWVLAPNTTEERVRRGVKLALYEWGSTGPVEGRDDSFNEAAAHTKDELRRIIERACSEMGWEVAELEKRRVTPSFIVRTAGTDLGTLGGDLAYWWTVCSRYAHAQTLTVLLRGRRTHVATPYGGSVNVETDEELVADLLEFAVPVLNAFIRLTNERGLLRVHRP